MSQEGESGLNRMEEEVEWEGSMGKEKFES
jgi:hypothetical protein